MAALHTLPVYPPEYPFVFRHCECNASALINVNQRANPSRVKGSRRGFERARFGRPDWLWDKKWLWRAPSACAYASVRFGKGTGRGIFRNVGAWRVAILGVFGDYFAYNSKRMERVKIALVRTQDKSANILLSWPWSSWPCGVFLMALWSLASWSWIFFSWGLAKICRLSDQNLSDVSWPWVWFVG